MGLFLLPGLGVFLIGFLAFAIMSANYYYSSAHVTGARAFFDFILRNSPFGNLVTVTARLFTKAISGFMAKAVEATDASIGTSFHYIANEIKQTGDTLLQFSAFAITVAQAVTGQVTWREVAAQLRQLRATIRHAEHAAQVEGVKAIQRERAISHSIAQGVYPRIRAIEHEISRPIAHEIKSARTLAREAEREAHRAWKVARHALSRTSTKALAIALPAVIARLGWDWIKCKEAQNVYNKRGCNMWNELDALLGAGLFFVGAMSLVELARAEQAVVGDAAKIVRGFWEL